MLVLVEKTNKSKFLLNQKVVCASKSLELLHQDLFGPSIAMSLGGNYYALVIVDDYSRFTWTIFLALKHDAFKDFRKLEKIFKMKKI